MINEPNPFAPVYDPYAEELQGAYEAGYRDGLKRAMRLIEKELAIVLETGKYENPK